MSLPLYNSNTLLASLPKGKKMTTIIPNMKFYAPTLSNRINKFSNVKLTTLSRTRNRTFCNNVKAMAGDEASLQRVKQQQLQPKMKVSQASPRGNN